MNAVSTLRTRFAPSPTGLLHVGNAFSALQCQQWALTHKAELLLRIEDIDFTRCQPEHTRHIIEDLQWLGITWQGDVRNQSEHLNVYQNAIEQLKELGVIYPCFCTRKEIQQEIKHMGHAPHQEDIADPYPGTCRHISVTKQQRMRHEPFAWRLDIQKTSHILARVIRLESLGDIIIARKDIGVSYHLAVVVDDALQNITHIIRGEDLRNSTAIHQLLQGLLKLPSLIYHHHRLIHDKHGQRLAKRNQATTLKSLREAGISPQTLRNFLMQKGSIWPFEYHTPAHVIAQQLGSRA